MMTSRLQLFWDARKALKQGPAAIQQRQRARFAEIVDFARANSPYYRELYQALPQQIEQVTQLPITDKKKLMAHFDDWVTDRSIAIEQVRAFVNNPDRIGDYYLGQYTVATTSGTTGSPGIFILDDHSMAVTSALAFRMLSAWLGLGDLARIVLGGGRTAMINAMGGHFASSVVATRFRRKRVQVYPVQMPLPDMVAKLNDFRPVLLASYASIASLLASEQEGGRLDIHPVLAVLSAEGLPASEYDRIAKALNTKVRDSYASTECPYISYRCEYGWLHVNADWVLLEPVDAERRAVAPGQQSHTVLISNLANRVQPILRYDLGDSVMQKSDPCPCGNVLPAIRVQGRTADILHFPAAQGASEISIAPLVFGTIVDRISGIESFQLVQAAPTSLRLRLRLAAGTDPHRVWRELEDCFKQVLSERELCHVSVERADEPPEQVPGGKHRQIVPLARTKSR